MARKQKRDVIKANPARIEAIAAAALRANRQPYDGKTNAIFTEIKTLLAGRLPRDLKGEEAVRLMALMARFNAVSVEQAQRVDADVANRLDPNSGGTLVPA